ncbi:MAG: MurR/RpiR family transcriptional regulator [Romboutsia sp.]
MSILQKLETPDFKATKSDKLLIEYIKQNLDEIAYKPISQIAKESKIGEATITRFTRKIGFSSLQDFKVTLAKEVSSGIKRNIINSNIENDESAIETAIKLLNSNISTLTNTVDIINDENIRECSNLIINAKRIYFIGIGYSGIIAQDSNYKFMRIGLNCTSFDSSHTMIMMASIMEEGDLIVAISHTGETKEIIKTAQIAKNNNVKIISITEDKESHLKDISDIHLGYISGETLFESGSISSKVTQFFMIDLIYTQVVKAKFNESLERKLKTTDAINFLKTQ